MSERADVRRRFIGWTGHRTLPNEPAVRRAVKSVLEALTKRSVDAAMDLHVDWIGIGSAAIGADIIVAEACILLGLPVRIVLPCSVDGMLAVTPTEHKATVARVCAASEVTPAISHRIDTHPDYVAVAKEIASKADVLIAVWDGSPARGPGGTAEVVRLSEQLGTPIIRINPVSGDAFIPEIISARADP